MVHRIFQWNCHRLKASHNELLLLLIDLSSDIASLQETFLKQDDKKEKNYQIYNHTYESGPKAPGTSILIKNSIPQIQFNITTNLQAIVVTETA